MGYRNDEYSIKAFSDKDYTPKTFSGGHYGSSGNRDLASLGSGYAGDHYGSYSGGGGDCCPLVVDPLTYASLLGFIALATYFLNVLIAMSMLMMRRKRRRKRETDFRTFLAVDTLNNWIVGKLEFHWNNLQIRQGLS